MAKKVIKIEPVSSQLALELQPKKRTCAYCRVSSDSPEQHNSFVAQVEYYKGYIEKYHNWQYVGIYADKAKSGTKTNKRYEFLQMIKDCEAGKIDMIVTKSVTRFARNTVDSIQTVRKLKALGIAVYFEKENINTLTEKSEQMLTILSSLAQSESENTSTNVRWSINKRFRDGSYIISSPAFGYTNDEDGDLIIEPDEAKIARHIFNEYLSGKGSYIIAKELNESKVPTIRSSDKWQDGVIKEILQNPVYHGDLLLQKTLTTEVLPFNRKTNRRELPQFLFKDNHEAIITREEAEAIEKIYEYRRKQMGIDTTGKNQNRYAFSSNIICGECGSVFRRQKIYIGKPYEKIQWSCITHIEHISKCSLKGIREDVITSAFIVMWNKLTSNYSSIITPLLESLKNVRTDETQQEELAECLNKITNLTKQSHILSQSVAQGYIDSAIFISRKNEIATELDALKNRRNKLLVNSGVEMEIAQTEYLLNLIRKFPNILEEYDEQLFLQAVEKITIKENHTITFKLKNSLEFTEYCGEDVNRNYATTHANRL